MIDYIAFFGPLIAIFAILIIKIVITDVKNNKLEIEIREIRSDLSLYKNTSERWENACKKGVSDRVRAEKARNALIGQVKRLYKDRKQSL